MDENLEDKIADVQKSVAKLVAQVSKMAGKKVDEVMEMEDDMMDAAKDGVKQVAKAGKDKADAMNDLVAENPWLAIAVFSLAALAIGHLVGYAKGKE
jgi:ElaB/YqjD/DUF883 family membrane-anchored ribosome-binding protein